LPLDVVNLLDDLAAQGLRNNRSLLVRDLIEEALVARGVWVGEGSPLPATTPANTAL
jgi:metal-responsive CopG/Arc/MetJ family transcriptional regulator